MPCCMCEEYGWEDPQAVVFRDLESVKDYCLFHAPVERKGVTVREFNERVADRIQAIVDFDDEDVLCDFSGAVFPGNICFMSECNIPWVSFKNAHFLGTVSVYGCSFESDVDFSDALFLEEVDFQESTFNGTVDFAGAKFFNNAFFEGATMHGYADFMNSSFLGDVDFYDTTFRDGVAFCHVEFGGKVVFWNTLFSNEVKFMKTKFSVQGAVFQTIQFEGSVEFTNISTINKTILSFINCKISHSEILIQDCDPRCCDFTMQRDLRNIHFINSPWDIMGRVKASAEEQEGNLQLVRDFYQRMKAKYKTENNEYEASKWHVAEKESQLKLLGRKDGSRFLRDVLWLYKYSSGFGEDPRQAFWVLLMLLVLPLLFLVCIELSNNFVWWGFDHSRIDAVFTEWLKFIPLTRAADKNELGLLYAFMVFWQLLITIQTALFVFALRNNFRR